MLAAALSRLTRRNDIQPVNNQHLYNPQLLALNNFLRIVDSDIVDESHINNDALTAALANSTFDFSAAMPEGPFEGYDVLGALLATADKTSNRALAQAIYQLVSNDKVIWTNTSSCPNHITGLELFMRMTMVSQASGINQWNTSLRSIATLSPDQILIAAFYSLIQLRDNKGFNLKTEITQGILKGADIFYIVMFGIGRGITLGLDMLKEFVTNDDLDWNIKLITLRDEAISPTIKHLVLA